MQRAADKIENGEHAWRNARSSPRSSSPRISTRATTGSGRSWRWGPAPSISRNASISAGCTATASAARARRWRHSGLGALLIFDQYNIRYITSTVIGEWARDKFTRYALLPGNGEPHVWDFGSAAKHHRLYAPWLHQHHCHAGMLGLRGAVQPEIGLMRKAAEEIKSILDENGVADMPVGVDLVEPAMMFELQRAGIDVRDGQQVMLDAREIKSTDEISLLNMSAAHGRWHLPDHRRGTEARHPRERDRGARQQAALRAGLGRCRGDQRHLGRALQPASAQLHRPADPPRRPGLLRHHPVLYGLSHLLLPHLQCRPRHAAAARRLQARARMDRRRDRHGEARRHHRPDRRAAGPRPRRSASPARWRPSACSSATGWAWACTSGRSSPA